MCGAPLRLPCPVCGSEQDASAAFCSACGAALRPEARRAGAVSEHEERRVVTVLFADLAGSTALAESIDPEDVRAVQGELFELVNREVERHGGVSEKFVGDAVLAVFGVPRAHEDDPERAVRAALAIRDVFPAFASQLAERHGSDVGIRIGVNTGEVVAGREAAARGELVVTGDAVNVAARLQQLARPGAVLVGSRTRLATQQAVLYGERRELEAKGKAAPVEAWEATQVIDGGHRRGRAGVVGLVGRERELELLRLTAARIEEERSPQLVTIFGHAGVGKSRLVQELATVLPDARFVTGRCVPYGDGITYLPLVEAAGELTGVQSDDPVDVALAKVRRSVEAVAPAALADGISAALAWTMGLELPPGATGMTFGGDASSRLHEGWAHFLTALGRERLLVLVIDDIHWASEPLLELIESLAGTLEDTSVLLLCPSRPELLDARPSWGTGRLGSSALTLSPLSPGQSETLLQALLGADLIPDVVARAILEPAEGNPFFVEEMLSMLVEQGALERADGGWTATPLLGTASVPDSIHGVIAARIDLLQSSEREALRRCSVMGRTFWPSAVGIDEGVIAELGRRALVTEQPESSFSGRREFAFKHALTHDVAYASLPRVERRELHRRVADWILEALPDRQAETTELVAYHYEQALAHGEPDPELQARAFDSLLGAGEAAIRLGAYGTASGLSSRALDVAPSEEGRARALLLAARVDIHTRNGARALARLEEALGAAERLDDPSLRADVLGWYSRACWLGGRWQDARAASEAAVATLETAPESPELARALARLSQIEMLRGLPEAEATALRAIELAERTGERVAEANARTNLFTSRANRGVVPERAEIYELAELAQRAGAHDEAARALVNYLWSAWETQPLTLVESTVQELAEKVHRGLAAEAYDDYLRLSLATLVYVPAGRWSEAEAVGGAERTFTQASTHLVWLWLVTGLALRRGDLERVDQLLPEFRELALATEEPQRILPLASIAVPRAVIAEDLEEVRELADVALQLPMMTVSSASALALCRALAAAGEFERLEQLVEAIGGSDIGVRGATVDLAGGLLARARNGEEAASLLERSESCLRALGRDYDAACVALELARALETVGAAADASTVRGRAVAVLEPLGCVYPW
jgi:class 3 adenylate cyclase/predicted ATPase